MNHCKLDQAALHRLVLDLEVHKPLAVVSLEGVGQLVLVGTLVRSIERHVVELETGITKLVGVSAHRGEKQDELLLVVFFVRAEPEIFRHEDGHGPGLRQVAEREQLVAENDEHVGRRSAARTRRPAPAPARRRGAAYS